MPRAIITGASGFVGSNLARYLVKNKWEIILIVRKHSNLSIINDIVDKIIIYRYDGSIEKLVSFFKEQKADVVFHLASLFIAEHNTKDVDNLIDSNLRFGLHILEAMSKSDTKLFVNTGTSWQHYNNEEYNPVDLYAATKEAFEKLLRYYTEAEGIRSVILTLFDTYGENDPRPKLINLLKKFADEKKVLDMSPGGQSINLVHVDDVVKAFLKSYEYLLSNKHIKERKFFVANKEYISLQKLISIFENVSGKNIIINWGAKPYRKREVMTQLKSFKVVPNWSVTKKVASVFK